MHFLNDLDYFMAIVYILEWIAGARAASSVLQCLGSVLRYSTSWVIESHSHPADS